MQRILFIFLTTTEESTIKKVKISGLGDLKIYQIN
jgi:hypothetical protein